MVAQLVAEGTTQTEITVDVADEGGHRVLVPGKGRTTRERRSTSTFA